MLIYRVFFFRLLIVVTLFISIHGIAGSSSYSKFLKDQGLLSVSSSEEPINPTTGRNAPNYHPLADGIALANNKHIIFSEQYPASSKNFQMRFDHFLYKDKIRDTNTRKKLKDYFDDGHKEDDASWQADTQPVVMDTEPFDPDQAIEKQFYARTKGIPDNTSMKEAVYTVYVKDSELWVQFLGHKAVGDQNTISSNDIEEANFFLTRVTSLYAFLGYERFTTQDEPCRYMDAKTFSSMEGVTKTDVLLVAYCGVVYAFKDRDEETFLTMWGDAFKYGFEKVTTYTPKNPENISNINNLAVGELAKGFEGDEIVVVVNTPEGTGRSYLIVFGYGFTGNSTFRSAISALS